MARFLLLGLAVVILAPVVAADGGQEGLAPGVGQLYRDAVQVLSGDPADGAQGVLHAALYPSIDGPATWQLLRDAQEQAESGRVVQELARHAPQAVPAEAAAGLPFVVVGAARGQAGESSDLDFAGRVEEAWDERLAGDAGASAEETLAALPVDARAAADGLAAQLGGVSLEALLAPHAARADAPAPERAPPSTAREVRGAYAPATAAASPPGTREGLRAALPAVPLASPLGSPDDSRAPAPARAQASEGASLVQPALPAAALALALIVLLPPLYHRLHRSTLLDHAIRARLCGLVEQRPGIHIEDLGREAGCSRSTAVYHLRLLARHGHILARPGRKSVHYYPNDGRIEGAERAQRALLASRRKRQLAACIAAHPGIGRGELAGAAGIAASTLTWHMGPLLELGLVEERPGPSGARGLFSSPSLPALLRPWTDAVPPPSRATTAAAPPKPPMTFA